MLLNFIVIGAMKSGTTNLCHQLSLHPKTFISDPKTCTKTAGRVGW